MNKSKKGNSKSELTTRYTAYQVTCHKYRHEIKAVQKYLPNWQPAFNY